MNSLGSTTCHTMPPSSGLALMRDDANVFSQGAGFRSRCGTLGWKVAP